MKRIPSLSLYAIIGAILLIVFNVCFFLLTSDPDLCPDGRNAAGWVNYACCHLAFALLLATPWLYPKNATPEIAMPVWTITITFWWVEFLIGLYPVVLLLIRLYQIKYDLLDFLMDASEYFRGYADVPLGYIIGLQTVLWGIVLIALIILYYVNRDTTEKQERHTQELAYVKTADALLRTRLNATTDKAIFRQIEQVYDLIRTSPLKSNAAAQQIESQILGQVSALAMEEDPATIKQLCADITRMAVQRNQILLLNN